MLVEGFLFKEAVVKADETVVMEPDVFVTISVNGHMVAVAGIFDDANSDSAFDVGVGIRDRDDVEAVCSILASAIAAFRDADWQLVLPFGDEPPETETAPPF